MSLFKPVSRADWSQPHFLWRFEWYQNQRGRRRASKGTNVYVDPAYQRYLTVFPPDLPSYIIFFLFCPTSMQHFQDQRKDRINMSHLWHRPRTAEPDGTGHGTHKVSFSDSSKSSRHDSGRPSSASNSRPSSPRILSPRGDRGGGADRPRSQHLWSENRSWQRVNRQSEALWQSVDFQSRCTVRC